LAIAGGIQLVEATVIDMELDRNKERLSDFPLFLLIILIFQFA